jgi:hypothetical protein
MATSRRLGDVKTSSVEIRERIPDRKYSKYTTVTGEATF